jgi:hypothetical protein
MQEILERTNLLTFLTSLNKLNRIHRYDIAQNYRILVWFSICPNTTSKFHTTIFKRFVKENFTCRYFNDLLLFQT